MTVYNVSETPVAKGLFPSGSTVTISLKDPTGADIPISDNSCVESGSGEFTWSFENVTVPPTEPDSGIQGYWIMTSAEEYPDTIEQFQWGEVAGKEIAFGRFEGGKTVSIKLWDIQGNELEVNDPVCSSLANDPAMYSWSFDNLVSYPDSELKGYWSMEVSDGSLESVSRNFTINSLLLSASSKENRKISSVRFLREDHCLYEDEFKYLKVVIKLPKVDLSKKDHASTQLLSAKIFAQNGLSYALPWNEMIGAGQTKIIKEVDLTTVSFLDGKIGLGCGTHQLVIEYGGEQEIKEFKVMPISVSRLKKNYLLGVSLESVAEIGIQQELRKITGVEIMTVSNDTKPGMKTLVWDASNKTLSWDNGDPQEITENQVSYNLPDMMNTPGLVHGDYLTVSIEDPESLPAEDVTETVIVDTIKYSLADFQHWIEVGFNTLCETIIMTSIEPTLYSTNRDTKYKYFTPASFLPKRQSRSSHIHFEFAVNQLREIVELKTHHAKNEERSVELNRVEIDEDGRVIIKGFPFARQGLSSFSILGGQGLWDKTINADIDPNGRNPIKNFFHGTVIAGIQDDELRRIAIDIIAKIASIDLLIQAGLGKGAGIASRSTSVGGISTSYNTVESAENAMFSSTINTFAASLGIGKATKEEQRVGLINRIKRKVEGTMAFKI